MSSMHPEEDRVELALDINMEDVDVEEALTQSIKRAILQAFGEVAEEGVVADRFGSTDSLPQGSWTQDSLFGDTSTRTVEPPRNPAQEEANREAKSRDEELRLPRRESFNEQRGSEIIGEDTNILDLGEMWGNLDDIDPSTLTADQQEELKALQALQGRLKKEQGSLSGQAKTFIGDMLPGRGGTSGVEKAFESFTQNASLFSQLGGVGGGVGLGARAIPLAGAALAAYQGVQAGGEQLQALADIGNVQGTGIRGGIEFQGQVATMAMNPFISTEQARSIMMTALKEGYTGEEFDTLTGFMAENMKDMGMSISDSMRLFKSSVEDGGQAIESLSLQLETLKRGAESSNISLQEAQGIYADVAGSVVDAGTSGQAAGRAGTIASQMFADTPELAGVSNRMFQSMHGNYSMQSAIARSRGQGELPDVAEHNALEEDTWWDEAFGILRERLVPLIRQFPNWQSDQNQRSRLRSSFRVSLRQFDMNFLTDDQVDELIKQLIEGDPIADAKSRVEENSGIEIEEMGSGEQTRSMLGTYVDRTKDLWKRGQTAVPFIGPGGVPLIPGTKAYEDWQEVRKGVRSTGDDSRITLRQDLARQGISYGALETLINQENFEDIMIRDGDEEYALSEAVLTRDLVDRIQSGEAKIALSGDHEYQSLSELATSSFATGDSDTFLGSPGAHITVSPTPELERLLNFTVEDSPEIRNTNAGNEQPNAVGTFRSNYRKPK